MKKYYEILEVHPKASQEIIEKAYRVLVKKYHPDLYSGEKRLYAEKKLRDINESYKILSDEFLREQYDLELEKEIEFDRMHSSNTRKDKKQNIVSNKKNKQEKDIYEQENTIEKHDVGTLMGLLDVTREVFKNKPNINKSVKEFKREDFIAAGLTILIMLILGVILWFIPATNEFVRSILPFV